MTAVFWLAVWQLLYLRVRQDILIASPEQVLRRLADLTVQAGFWAGILGSLVRVLEGFLGGAALGILLAILTFCFVPCRYLLHPAVSVMKATPVASFIILALVWVRSGLVPVLAEIVIVTPIVWENITEGLRKTDRNLLQMARVFRFSSLRTVRRVYVPSVMPYFMASCATGMGMAWKGGVAAEILANLTGSIGGSIYRSKIYLETDSLFAWTLVVVTLSILLEKVMMGILRRTGKKYNTGGS